MKFDLVLAGGRVLDPSQNLDRVTQVGFTDGKVAAVGDDTCRGVVPPFVAFLRELLSRVGSLWFSRFNRVF